MLSFGQPGGVFDHRPWSATRQAIMDQAVESRATTVGAALPIFPVFPRLAPIAAWCTGGLGGRAVRRQTLATSDAEVTFAASLPALLAYGAGAEALGLRISGPYKAPLLCPCSFSPAWRRVSSPGTAARTKA